MEKAAVEALLDQIFAPWVQALDLQVSELTETGGQFLLPESQALVRGGGDGPKVVCGQALAAAADTLSVLALSHLNGRFRNCTTVDMTTHFMRPLLLGNVEAHVEAVSNGRRMAVTRVEFRAPGQTKIAATATCAFAYLED